MHYLSLKKKKLDFLYIFHAVSLEKCKSFLHSTIRIIVSGFKLPTTCQQEFLFFFRLHCYSKTNIEDSFLIFVCLFFKRQPSGTIEESLDAYTYMCCCDALDFFLRLELMERRKLSEMAKNQQDDLTRNNALSQ